MSSYFEEADPKRLAAAYPIGAAFEREIAPIGPEALRALQERRFRAVVDRAWQVPFYRRRWREAGLEPGDIRGLEDLERIPRYDKSDLMASVEASPPLGDYHGLDTPGAPAHAVLHTTSGTTGTPQPLLFGARDREIQNRLLARAYRAQGLADADVVHSVYGFGMVNGGHYVREAVVRYTRALMLPAGTGLETPSEQQVDLMRRFGVTVVLGFVDYIARLARVARERGIEPGRDLPVRMISGHLGAESRDVLAEAWGGAEVYDWYGVGDTGIVAAELADRDGLVVFEDAHRVEIVDPDTGAPTPHGEPGNLCVTTLFKDGIYPIIRFDTQDLSAWDGAPRDPAPGLRRIRGFLGRSDNMVKLRGINVYPTAIAAHLAGFPEATGEYVCVVRRVDGRDEMTVRVEWSGERTGPARETLARHLRERLAVEVGVELAGPGDTAASTGIERRQKPVRLIDERR